MGSPSTRRRHCSPYNGCKKQYTELHQLRRFFLIFTLVNIISLGIVVVLTQNAFFNSTSNDNPLQSIIKRNPLSTSVDHLIIVAGHSIAVSINGLKNAETDESVWWLADYMKGTGVHHAFVEHIRIGLRELRQDPNSLLVFSGGEIEENKSYGSVSVANSYLLVALAMELLHPKTDLLERTVTEEYSKDSFENLLFSICRFKEVIGVYPKKITVVGFTFKQYRFQNLHLSAIHYPLSQFQYIGYDPPKEMGFDLTQSTKGELENARQHFEIDPYGCLSKTLQDKRLNRNPFRKTPPYILSCPELRWLLEWCGPDLYNSKNNHRYHSLPWESSK